jgi:hypothetical protein
MTIIIRGVPERGDGKIKTPPYQVRGRLLVPLYVKRETGKGGINPP